VHVDMDAFFASIEQRENPAYRGRPVVVGADPRGGKGRGVVATCSYEARRYGVRSAQPISEAYRRCPHAVFLPVRRDLYEKVAGEVRQILQEFTPDIEPVSIDEAFLDVSRTVGLFGSKHRLAQLIRRRIEEGTGLTASLGVGPNKLVAKIASDMRKPRGLVIVEPQEVRAFLDPLPVERLWGVGERMQEALAAMGIHTIGELARADPEALRKRFGRTGQHLWHLAQGRDERPVTPPAEAKSIGHEHTFDSDTDDAELIASTLMWLCEKVARRLREAGRRGRTVTTKVRLADFTTLTRACTLEHGLDDAVEIWHAARANLRRAGARGRKVRLVGVSVSGLETTGARQTLLFEHRPKGPERREKLRRLARTVDRIKERFGEDALRTGASLPAGGGTGHDRPDGQDAGRSTREGARRVRGPAGKPAGPEHPNGPTR